MTPHVNEMLTRATEIRDSAVRRIEQVKAEECDRLLIALYLLIGAVGDAGKSTNPHNGAGFTFSPEALAQMEAAQPVPEPASQPTPTPDDDPLADRVGSPSPAADDAPRPRRGRGRKAAPAPVSDAEGAALPLPEPDDLDLPGEAAAPLPEPAGGPGATHEVAHEVAHEAPIGSLDDVDDIFGSPGAGDPDPLA